MPSRRILSATRVGNNFHFQSVGRVAPRAPDFIFEPFGVDNYTNDNELNKEFQSRS
jgi:hypothetical protein